MNAVGLPTPTVLPIPKNSMLLRMATFTPRRIRFTVERDLFTIASLLFETDIHKRQSLGKMGCS
jgi:hypothetical protein